MFFKLNKKKSILGVDIGTGNIKIAQVTHGDKPVLDTYGIVNTAYQLNGKDESLAIGRVADILRNLLEKAGATAKRCIISFPNSAVFSAVVQLPKMNDAELGSAVEFEAKKYVPLALSEVYLSWSAIGENVPLGKTQKILLTAVPKQIHANYMQLFEMAGLTPEVADIEALALIRSLIGNVPISCAIIDIGARSTSLNIIENGSLRLSRNLSIGGDTITDKIAQALNITQQRAEQFKKDFGVSQATFLPEAIRPVLNSIKTEAKQLLTIYGNQSAQLEKLLLVGGGANLPGLEEFFGDLNLRVELGNPFKSVAYSQNLEPVLKRYALSLPIAIGLALRNEN